MKRPFLICLLACSVGYLVYATRFTNSNAGKSDLRSKIEQNFTSSGKAKVDLYLMSLCPYGIEAQKALIPILKELGDKIDFNMYFIANELPGHQFQSLHGEPEIQEDRRQLTIARHFPRQLIKYLSHRLAHYSDTNWSASAITAGLDAHYIRRLVNQREEINAFRENIAMGNIKMIVSSPSMYINGTTYTGPYSPFVEKQCVGGTRDGLSCANREPCPKACVGGTKDKEECTLDNDVQCPDICEGGSRVNMSCSWAVHQNSECPGGTCKVGGCVGLGCVTFPLPVSLIQFKGSVSNNVALLTWQTASEANNKGYEVQHSADGIQWGKVDFVEGNGNSSIVHDYTWTSAKLLPGIHYYRLKQIDFDGNFNVYQIIALRITTELAFMAQAFPNPTNGTTSILVYSRDKARIKLHVINASGQEVLLKAYTVTSGDNIFLLDLKQIPAGRLTVVIESNGTIKAKTQLLLLK